MDDQDVTDKQVDIFLNAILEADETEKIFQAFDSYFFKGQSNDEMRLEKLRKLREIAKQIIDWVDKELCEFARLSDTSKAEYFVLSDSENNNEKDAGLNTESPSGLCTKNNVKKEDASKTSNSSTEMKVVPFYHDHEQFHSPSHCSMNDKPEVEKDTLESIFGNSHTVYHDNKSQMFDDQTVSLPDQSKLIELNNASENDKAEKAVVADQRGQIPTNTDIDPDEVTAQSEKNGENMKTRSESQSVFDTKNMWQDIPTRESTTTYYKQDKDSYCIDLEMGLRLIAASVRGRSHAHVGSPRDDDFYIHHSAISGWNILAVADGAGSCQFSRRGSQIAVKYAVEALSKQLESDVGQTLLDNYPKTEEERTDQEKLKTLQNALYDTLVKAAYAACEEINKQANDDSESVKDFSTTLLLAAHKKTEQGHFVISFWVGDGAIALYQENGDCILMGEPDGGEYAGQTRFLDERIFNDSSLMRRVKIKMVEDFTALILATDGVTDPNFNSDAELAEKPRWDEIWHEAKWGGMSLKEVVTSADSKSAENQLKDWSNFFSPRNHDDRTIAVLTHLKDSGNE